MIHIINWSIANIYYIFKFYPVYQDSTVVPSMIRARNYLSEFEGEILVILTKKDQTLLDHGRIVTAQVKKAKTYSTNAYGLVWESEVDTVGKMTADFISRDWPAKPKEEN
jgi:hypothetical protein